MHIPRIYHAEKLAPHTMIYLSVQASKHLLSVLRLQIGEALILFNGQGGQYRGRLAAVNKGRGIFQAIVEVLEFDNIEVESPLHIHLVQAISRADKMDYVMQKVVELGISEITPLMTERTVVKFNIERLHNKLLHWQQIIINACEQCGRNRIPVLHTIMHFNDWIKESKKKSELKLKLLLAPQAKKKLDDFKIPNKNILILVGAEGGFSDQEIQMAEQNRFIHLNLGPRIMRTETAALAMVAALQTRWGDF